jgi:exopolysaccharide biosynthesis polyprenyl glycosylphosphotransferase
VRQPDVLLETGDTTTREAPTHAQPAFLNRPFPLPARRRRRVAVEGRVRLAADAAALTLAAAVTALVGVGAGAVWEALSALGVLLALGFVRSYRPAPRLNLAEELRGALVAPALVALGLWCVRMAVTGAELPASALVITWLALSVALVASRATTRRLLATQPLRQRALIIGAGDVGRRVAQRLQDAPTAGIEPIGYLDKEPRDARPDDLPVLGASWDLERVVAEHGVQAVVVAFSTAPHHVLLRIVHQCWAMGVNVLVVPRLFEVDGSRAAMHHLGALPVVSLAAGEPRGWDLRLKYALDRLGAAAVVLALAPVLAALALAVLITSGRPIFYRQRRVGEGGRVFEMLKFRTMRSSPEAGGENDAAWAASILGGDGEPAQPVATQDRRTPVGSFLRKWSLDELPQLFNVLRGDMSLIGPRPERVAYVERFNDAIYRYPDRHRMRAGITGWAQVNGLRGETSLADRVEWDNHYIENWSLWLDAKIVLRSLQAVLGHRNAG